MSPVEKVVLNLQLTAQDVYNLRAWLRYTLPPRNSKQTVYNLTTFLDEQARAEAREVGQKLFEALGAALREPSTEQLGGLRHGAEPWFNDRERKKLFRRWLRSVFADLDIKRYACVCLQLEGRKSEQLFKAHLLLLKYTLVNLERMSRLGYSEGICYTSKGWCWNQARYGDFGCLWTGICQAYAHDQVSIDQSLKRLSETGDGRPEETRKPISDALLKALLRSAYCVIPESREGDYLEYDGDTLEEMDVKINGPCM